MSKNLSQHLRKIAPLHHYTGGTHTFGTVSVEKWAVLGLQETFFQKNYEFSQKLMFLKSFSLTNSEINKKKYGDCDGTLLIYVPQILLLSIY